MTPDDEAALARLRRHLGGESARATVEAVDGAWRCDASGCARNGRWYAAVAVSAYAATAGEAICEAGRRLGVAP